MNKKLILAVAIFTLFIVKKKKKKSSDHIKVIIISISSLVQCYYENRDQGQEPCRDDADCARKCR